MKAALQLQLGQHLTLTPQLQQAIRLLQLSTLELQQEIQENLNSNPLLEMSDESNAENTSEESNASTNDENIPSTATEDSQVDLAEHLTQEALPEELPSDSVWEDVWQNTSTNTSHKASDEQSPIEFQRSKQASLQDHLLWQADISKLSENDYLIATALIDAINEHGFLTCSLEDIHQSINQQIEEPFDLEEVEAVLHHIQNFEPLGVAARNLQECLLLQLKNLPEDTLYYDAAFGLLTNFFPLLSQRDLSQIIRKTKWEEATIKGALQLIQQLNPRPGTQMTNAETDYVIPDVRVVRRKDQWIVELNQEALPKIRINQTYANILNNVQKGQDQQYLKQQLQEARWFMKSLHSRNETLMKVANCIFEHQREFLEKGAEQMKPLVLHHIAEQISMHESTVSRITTQKFVETPRGIFELKYFFSSHVGTHDGGECSSTAIRARIKKLIAEEPNYKPLSDSKIAAILSREGINVARRTVAKYRESLHIPPSNERKSFV